MTKTKSRSSSSSKPSKSLVNGMKDLYLTPQIEKQAKRRDGLCPSLLRHDHVESLRSKTGNEFAAVTKSYETNSKYLTSLIRDMESDADELQFIIKCVNQYLGKIVDEKKEKDGSRWNEI